MTIQALDFYFPQIVFFSGLFLTLVYQMPFIKKLADSQLDDALKQRFFAHEPMALLFTAVGGLWLIQRIWLAT